MGGLKSFWKHRFSFHLHLKMETTSFEKDNLSESAFKNLWKTEKFRHPIFTHIQVPQDFALLSSLFFQDAFNAQFRKFYKIHMRIISRKVMLGYCCKWSIFLWSFWVIFILCQRAEFACKKITILNNKTYLYSFSKFFFFMTDIYFHQNHNHRLYNQSLHFSLQSIASIGSPILASHLQTTHHNLLQKIYYIHVFTNQSCNKRKFFEYKTYCFWFCCWSSTGVILPSKLAAIHIDMFIFIDQSLIFVFFWSLIWCVTKFLFNISCDMVLKLTSASISTSSTSMYIHFFSPIKTM